MIKIYPSNISIFKKSKNEIIVKINIKKKKKTFQQYKNANKTYKNSMKLALYLNVVSQEEQKNIFLDKNKQNITVLMNTEEYRLLL